MTLLDAAERLQQSAATLGGAFQLRPLRGAAPLRPNKEVRPVLIYPTHTHTHVGPVFSNNNSEKLPIEELRQDHSVVSPVGESRNTGLYAHAET